MATFELVDELFDDIAGFAPLTSVIESTAISTQWNYQFSASKANLLAQRIGVQSLVDNHVFGSENF